MIDLRLAGPRDEFRAMLEAGDVAGLMAASDLLFPPGAQPKDYRDAERYLHIARTVSDNIPFDARAYSHRWLTERDLPSLLPDHLKPKAERMYPVIVEAVGISMNTRNPFLKPVVAEAHRAMQDAVEDCYANGDRDPVIVRARMAEAKDNTFRLLLGGTDTWRRR